MNWNRGTKRMRALLCAAAVCAGILQTGAAYPEGLEPVQQGIAQEAASLIPGDQPVESGGRL